MHVDAVLILRWLIGEIVGEAEHARELVPDLRIEIGVAAAGVDRPVADADIDEARWAVGPDRYVAGDVGHVVVHARIPAQRRYRDDISKAVHRVADSVEARERQRAERRRQRAWDCPRQAFDAISTVTVPEEAIAARHYNECIAKAGLSTGQLAENMREYAETQPGLQNKPAPGVLRYLISLCGRPAAQWERRYDAARVERRWHDNTLETPIRA